MTDYIERLFEGDAISVIRIDGLSDEIQPRNLRAIDYVGAELPVSELVAHLREAATQLEKTFPIGSRR